MKRKYIIDSLPAAERRRVEALALVIAWNKEGFAEISDYFAHAEEVERWIADAAGRPDDPPAQVGSAYLPNQYDDEEEFGEHNRRYG